MSAAASASQAIPVGVTTNPPAMRHETLPEVPV
jgi:hypothetical protein